MDLSREGNAREDASEQEQDWEYLYDDESEVCEADIAAAREGEMEFDNEMREAGELHQRRQEEATAELEKADSDENEDRRAGEGVAEEQEDL